MNLPYGTQKGGTLSIIHMITEISPIFGLNLLSILEILTIITGFSSLVVAVAILYTYTGQKKIASANLVVKYLEPWTKDKQFGDMILKLEKPNAQFTNENQVHSMLSKFEDIAILWKDKTLTKTHVREFFGRDIIRINTNESVMKFLNDYNKEDPAHNYNNLKKLLNNSKKWEMKPYSSDGLSSGTS